MLLALLNLEWWERRPALKVPLRRGDTRQNQAELFVPPSHRWRFAPPRSDPRKLNTWPPGYCAAQPSR